METTSSKLGLIKYSDTEKYPVGLCYFRNVVLQIINVKKVKKDLDCEKIRTFLKANKNTLTSLFNRSRH